jgi:phospholipid/cholesterol/gamma-HCH transport system substrate-binding protein
MERNVLQEIKVGLVVLGLLLLMAFSVFFLGGSTNMLEGRYRLHASFGDISGLREGAVVRLAGIDVGEVTSIKFSDDPSLKRVFVQLNVMERYKSRIREDSVASIQTEGVLGDKYIAVSVGSPEKNELEGGAWITTNEPLEFLSYVTKATEILDNSAGIARKINFMLGDDQDSARASLANAITTLEALLREVKDGDGTLHVLLYDEAMARNLKTTVSNLRDMSTSLNRTAQAVESGDGLAHELIHGPEGKEFARQLGDLAQALESLTRDIKNENSLVHSLIYEPEKARLVDDLQVTAAALREVSEDLRSGKGTLGMLANDPALYEDLRALVGGAQRNKLLRTYIRRTIQMAEEKDASGWKPVESGGSP